MFLSAYLIALLAQAPVPRGLEATNELERVKLDYGARSITFDWADAEDRIKGTLTPPQPRQGQPLTVSVFVGSFQGEAFAGPVTLSLKPVGGMGKGEVITVIRPQGERNWTHTFVPSERGDHVLEVAFFSTRRKVARATLAIGDPGVPTWLAAVIAGSLVLFIIGGGVMLANRRKAGEAAAAPGEPPSAAGAPADAAKVEAPAENGPLAAPAKDEPPSPAGGA